jgi:hypothetical protein
MSTSPNATSPPAGRGRPSGAAHPERGQVALELALTLPVLLLLLLIALEAGLFLAEHISVVNAAREGARYLVDGGAPAEVAAVATGNSRGLAVTDPARYQVWVITGATDGAGNVLAGSWSAQQVAGPTPPVAPSLTPALVAEKLRDCNTAAPTPIAGTPVPSCGPAAAMRFVAVEVAYEHRAITGSYLLPSGTLTLRSASLIRRT